MKNRNSRLLWLINHKTLRNFEVPLLLDLGYEVFTPKIYPTDIANISASVDYTYDQYLTIPARILSLLNNHYFYNDYWSQELIQETNKYFETVICACFPNMINHVVHNFEGKILLRAFGLAGKNTYANYFETYCAPDVVGKIKLNNSKIRFASSYATISLNEPQWLRNITAFLPLGLPPYMYNYQETWQGTINKILFVCSRINALGECRKLYDIFKEYFGDLPYSIAGAQPVPVNDENVLGFVQEEQYRQLMQNYKVMFYHSREERHLHYHPLEALVYGMPLIFMSGGLLDQISGKQLPGRCENYTDAKEKIQKILSGDSNFINEIKLSQKIILNLFSKEYIYEQWKNTFTSFNA
jgi:hypothetical protein